MGADASPSPSSKDLMPSTRFNRRLVKWVDGSPVLESLPMFTPAQVTDLMFAAAALPYSDPDDELAISMGLPPSRFYGMTNLEVMVIRRQEAASKTGEGAEPIFDRLLGKPKATAEIHTTTETYEQYLARIAKSESSKRVDAARPVNVVAEISTIPVWDEL